MKTLAFGLITILSTTRIVLNNDIKKSLEKDLSKELIQASEEVELIIHEIEIPEPEVKELVWLDTLKVM